MNEQRKNTKIQVPADLLHYARQLRTRQTDAESFMWQLLRNRRFAGKKFRRQYPIGQYILDFYCHELQLAIELDGGQHNEAVALRYDEARTRFLHQQGIEVLRFWNNEVFLQEDSVLEMLWQAVHSTPTP